ncbi:MAG TPA: hypothetical protein VHF70_05265 [Rubrobacteraceae bacterium]|nr:hypothetical protein [Rubrobacteraceae bacterium]
MNCGRITFGMAWLLLRELGEEVVAFYGARTTGKHAISLTESKSCLIHRMDPPNIPQGKGTGT